MSQGRHFRRCSHALMFRAGLAFVMLFALLNARDFPSHFQTTSKAYSTLSSDSEHDQRPRFDHFILDWNTPAPTVLPFPAFDIAARLTPSPQLFSTLQPKGFHFNRPPPFI
jgi:hypothetical protein